MNASADGAEVHQFLTDRCMCFGRNTDFIQSSVLVEAFKEWRQDRGLPPLTAITAAKRLAAQVTQWNCPIGRFKPSRHKAGVAGYLGLVFKPESSFS